MRTRTSRLPWRDGDIVMLSLTTLATALVIAAAWIGASDTGSMGTMAVWVQVAIAALVVFAVGVCLWLLRGWRTLTERRVALFAESYDGEPAPNGQVQPRPGATGDQLVWAQGMSHVHRSDCPLVAGKPVETATFADGTPCGVCHG